MKKLALTLTLCKLIHSMPPSETHNNFHPKKQTTLYLFALRKLSQQEKFKTTQWQSGDIEFLLYIKKNTPLKVYSLALKIYFNKHQTPPNLGYAQPFYANFESQKLVDELYAQFLEDNNNLNT